MGKHLLTKYDVTVRKIDVVVFADVTITVTGEGYGVSDSCSHIPGYIADTVPFDCNNLDGVWIAGIRWFRLQGSDKLAEVFADMFTVGNASNVKFYNVWHTLIFWPYLYIITIILDAEVM